MQLKKIIKGKVKNTQVYAPPRGNQNIHPFHHLGWKPAVRKTKTGFLKQLYKKNYDPTIWKKGTLL